jgi:hypothetical protein
MSTMVAATDWRNVVVVLAALIGAAGATWAGHNVGRTYRRGTRCELQHPVAEPLAQPVGADGLEPPTSSL